MPLADLLMERFKVRTRAVENPQGVTTLGTTAEIVLANNPNRLAWIIVNLHSTQVVYLSLTSDVAATRGVRLDPAGGSASMIWDEDFQATGWAIWGVGSAADVTLYSIEIVEY